MIRWSSRIRCICFVGLDPPCQILDGFTTMRCLPNHSLKILNFTKLCPSYPSASIGFREMQAWMRDPLALVRMAVGCLPPCLDGRGCISPQHLSKGSIELVGFDALKHSIPSQVFEEQGIKFKYGMVVVEARGSMWHALCMMVGWRRITILPQPLALASLWSMREGSDQSKCARCWSSNGRCYLAAWF